MKINIYLFENQKLIFGLPNVYGFANNKRIIFKPLFVNAVIILMIFRNLTTILVRNELISKIMSDFSYNWDLMENN